MPDNNYYDILGVSRDAGEPEIKRAYRRLARKYHPDVNPGDKSTEPKFKKINEAYEVLSNKENRKKYDRFGDRWQHADQFARAGGQQAPTRDFSQRGGSASFDFGETDLDSLFDELLRGTRPHTYTRRARPRQGRDIKSPIDITLEEAHHGTTRTISLQITEPCPTCQGRGLIQNVPCSTCQGAGAINRVKRLEVKIPAGVDNGSRVRIPGKGQPGYAGANGDLYLVISVKSHRLFKRRGNDLHAELPVPLTTVMLGGEVQVPTLKGKLPLRIPPETQNGRIFRLKGQGMPHLGNSSRGDMLAKVNVALPAKLSPQEKELFKRLSELQPTN